MDDLTEPVQPDEGQGGAGTADAPYAEWLNRIPEEVRGDVEPVFKEWDANVTRRFQEASEYRKNWEPFEKVGVNKHDPAAVEWALQFYNAAQSNPQDIKEWYERYATENGLQAKSEVAAPEPALDEFAGLYDTPNIEQILKQQLSPLQEQLQQLASWRENQERQAREQEALRMIEGQIADFRKKDPDAFAGPGEQAIEKFIANYIETDPQHAVERAFNDWQTIRNQLEKETLQAKVNQPPPAESGGVPDGAPEQIRTLADANRVALERIRQSRGI